MIIKNLQKLIPTTKCFYWVRRQYSLCGMNLSEFILKHSGLFTTAFVTRDRHMGLDGEFIKVLVSRKPI